MPKYPSAATYMRVWNIVLHSIKTIIKHTINGEKRIYIAEYILKVFWAINSVANVTLFCINHKVFFIIIVRLLWIRQVIIVNQHLWHTVSNKTKGPSYCYYNMSNIHVHLLYRAICPPQNSDVAHVTLESRGKHNTNWLYLNQIPKLINFRYFMNRIGESPPPKCFC